METNDPAREHGRCKLQANAEIFIRDRDGRDAIGAGRCHRNRHLTARQEVRRLTRGCHQIGLSQASQHALVLKRGQDHIELCRIAIHEPGQDRAKRARSGCTRQQQATRCWKRA